MSKAQEKKLDSLISLIKERSFRYFFIGTPQVKIKSYYIDKSTVDLLSFILFYYKKKI